MFCLEATAKEKRQCAGAKGGVVPTYTVWRYEDVILKLELVYFDVRLYTAAFEH